MKKKRFIACGLVLALVLGLTACDSAEKIDRNDLGNQNTKSSSPKTTKQETPDLSYQSRFLSVSSTDDGICMVKIKGNKIYEVSVGLESEGTLFEQSYTAEGLEDRKQVMTFDAQGEVVDFCVDTTGNLYTIAAVSDETSEEGSSTQLTGYRLRKFSPEGRKIYDEEIDPGNVDYFYPGVVVADSKGRAYVSSMNTIFRFDENGQKKGSINDGGCYFGSISINQDDNLYCEYTKYDNDAVCELSEYTFEGDQPIHTYKNFVNVQGRELLSAEGDMIYALSSDGICAYSLKKEAIVDSVILLNCNVEASSVESFVKIGDDYFLALGKDDFTVWQAANQGKEYELARVWKADASEVQEKQVIVYGAPSVGSVMQERIIELNKKSDKYRIVVKSYYDESEGYKEGGYEEAMERFRNDLITGNGPDIIDLRFINPAPLFAKGVLEDLYPYLEKSESVSKDFFVDGILDKMSYNGKLYCIQDSFSVDTVIGKTSIVGNKSGWSVSDLLNTVKAHPNMKLVDGLTKSMFLQVMLTLNMDQFIDFAAGECHFDSEDFKSILELANTLEEEIDYEQGNFLGVGNDPSDAIRKEKTMLYMHNITSFTDYTMMEMLFGDQDFTKVGYPSGKGNGCAISGTGGLGIASRSSNKDAAWAFMEDYIKLLDVENLTYGFPVTRGKYERFKRAASEVHYLTDSEGNIMYDNNGDPIKSTAGPMTIAEFAMSDPDPLTDQQAKEFENMLKEGIGAYERMDEELFKIIEEEAEYYFAGAKSVDDVANVIQNRIGIYVKEN